MKSSHDGYNAKCRRCASIIMKSVQKTKTFKDRKNSRRRERRKSDWKYRITENIRTGVKMALKKVGIAKRIPTNKYADIKAIAEHIGPPPGPGYHIDHIFPISAFDLSDTTHVKICYHPSNLRWIPAKENIMKSSHFNQNDFLEFFERTKLKIR